MTDHVSPGLLWNERTRQELRDALHAEEQALRLGRIKVADGSGGRPSWNHWEFGVQYPSLARTLCVGGVYLRLLLEGTGQVCVGVGEWWGWWYFKVHTTVWDLILFV